MISFRPRKQLSPLVCSSKLPRHERMASLCAFADELEISEVTREGFATPLVNVAFSKFGVAGVPYDYDKVRETPCSTCRSEVS